MLVHSPQNKSQPVAFKKENQSKQYKHNGEKEAPILIEVPQCAQINGEKVKVDLFCIKNRKTSHK